MPNGWRSLARSEFASKSTNRGHALVVKSEPAELETSYFDAKLHSEYNRLRGVLVGSDPGRSRNGPGCLLRDAILELPSYLDLASQDCGPYVIAYPDEAGGDGSWDDVPPARARAAE